jgi:Arc/MetJ family transcription regulator
MPTAAYQSYEVEGVFRAALYLPDQTILMSRDWSGAGWQIDDRDQHNFGEVPVVRFPNRARSADREGRSEITPAVMNTTDSACRSLLGMEIAREFYSVPHRYILGAQESDFQDAAGNAKSQLDMVMSKMLAVERNEEGQLPTVGQFNAFDPSVFTKIIDKHATLMASYTQFPPSYFGEVTSANPASADAIRVAENGVDRGGLRCQNQFSTPLERVQCLVWRFANEGRPLPAEFSRLETDWVDASTPTPAATSDALFKQAQMGAIPAASDVTLKKLGYTQAERVALGIDRAQDEGMQFLQEIAHSLTGRVARVDKALAADVTPDPAGTGQGGQPPAAA